MISCKKKQTTMSLLDFVPKSQVETINAFIPIAS